MRFLNTTKEYITDEVHRSVFGPHALRRFLITATILTLVGGYFADKFREFKDKTSYLGIEIENPNPGKEMAASFMRHGDSFMEGNNRIYTWPEGRCTGTYTDTHNDSRDGITDENVRLDTVELRCSPIEEGGHSGRAVHDFNLNDLVPGNGTDHVLFFVPGIHEEKITGESAVLDAYKAYAVAKKDLTQRVNK